MALVSPEFHLAAVGAAGLTLLVAYRFGDASARYGAWLLVFSLWMAWFVVVAATAYESGIDE
jgi:hypothetical protein